MSKLNSDNPDLMPITDAVYGKPPKRKADESAKHFQRRERQIADTEAGELLAVLFPKKRKRHARG